MGELPLTAVLLNDPEIPVREVMDSDPATFQPEDKADEAAGAFERYDLISAPVVDAKGKLMGRLTIEEIVDAVNEESDTNLRRMGGLSPEEDVFAPVSKAVKTRWAWLAINLCTAFIASRVIGLFEHTISQLVALAALMPIVAGIGGNTGNQTITMIVRALALHQIEVGNISRLMLQRAGRRHHQRRGVGRHHGRHHLAAVRRRGDGRRDDAGDAAQSAAGGADGRSDPDDHAQNGPRSGGRLQRAHHRADRYRRLFSSSSASPPCSCCNTRKAGRAPAFSPFCRRVCVNAVKSAIPVGFPLALYYPLPINRLNSSTS